MGLEVVVRIQPLKAYCSLDPQGKIQSDIFWGQGRAVHAKEQEKLTHIWLSYDIIQLCKMTTLVQVPAKARQNLYMPVVGMFV